MCFDNKSMTKVAKYEALMPKMEALMEGVGDTIAKMANMAALLHQEMGFWWTGFYRVTGDELTLGPFQGPVACTRIGFGKGVCGTAWKEMRTVVVPDVEQFPGHIACSSESRSEIVVPLWHGGSVVAVLDIDSREIATFDEVDRGYLEKISALIYGPQTNATRTILPSIPTDTVTSVPPSSPWPAREEAKQALKDSMHGGRRSD